MFLLNLQSHDYYTKAVLSERKRIGRVSFQFCLFFLLMGRLFATTLRGYRNLSYVKVKVSMTTADSDFADRLVCIFKETINYIDVD